MKTSSANSLSKILNISTSRGLEAYLKANLISAITTQLEKLDISHTEVARRSGIPRSAVTGILSGSLQKVSLGRLLRILEVIKLTVEFKIKEAA